jgi:hypothetical protein
MHLKAATTSDTTGQISFLFEGSKSLMTAFVINSLFLETKNIK